MVAPRLTENGAPSLLRPALVLLLLFTVLAGAAYPLLVHGIAQTLFPRRANGSLVQERGRVVGSELIGQPFSGREWFWSRPSATVPPYDGTASGGSNLGAANPARRQAIAARRQGFGDGAVPVDLVTASASGLDPHISPEGALFQVERVARARGRDPEELRRLVVAHVEPPTLGLLGEARVNVLRLNLALNGVK